MRRPPASFGVGWQPQPLLDAFQMLPSSPARGPPSFAWKAEPEGFFYSHLARKGEQQKCLSSPSSPSLQERAECRCGAADSSGRGWEARRFGAAAGTQSWGGWRAWDKNLGRNMDRVRGRAGPRCRARRCNDAPGAHTCQGAPHLLPRHPSSAGLGDVPGVLAELGSLFVAAAGTFGVGRRFLPERQRWRAGERRGKEGRERGRAR